MGRGKFPNRVILNGPLKKKKYLVWYNSVIFQKDFLGQLR